MSTGDDRVTNHQLVNQKLMASLADVTILESKRQPKVGTRWEVACNGFKLDTIFRDGYTHSEREEVSVSKRV